MTTIIDDIKAHTILVENGSGVLVQPMDESHTYILTAKHVIEIAKDSKTYKGAENISARRADGTEFTVRSVHIHPDIDAALLALDFIGNITIPLSLTAPKRGDKVIVCGSPTKRRNENIDSVREFDGIIKRYGATDWELFAESHVDYEEVVGISGGGLFLEQNDSAFLLGVETSISGLRDIENTNRIEGVTLKAFQEILLFARGEGFALPDLLPLHLGSFSSSISSTFDLRDGTDPETGAFVRKVLHGVAKKLIDKNAPQPLAIKKGYESRLLISGRDLDELLDQKLWASYLEYLIISTIVDDKDQVSIDYILELNGRRRFFYASTDGSWTTLLQNVFKSDLIGLRKSGRIIIATKGTASRACPNQITLKSIIPDISRADLGDYRIDSIFKSFEEADFKIMHIAGMAQECIIDKEHEFQKFDNTSISELVSKLKAEFNEFL